MSGEWEHGAPCLVKVRLSIQVSIRIIRLDLPFGTIQQHLTGSIANNACAMVFRSFFQHRGASFLQTRFALDKARSVGFGSGEYRGRQTSIAFRFSTVT